MQTETEQFMRNLMTGSDMQQAGSDRTAFLRAITALPVRSSTRRFAQRSLMLLMAAVLVATPDAAYAQPLTKDLLTSGPAVRAAFRTVIAPSSRATVWVLDGDTKLSLGAIVDADGFILSKASQLHGSLNCLFKDGKKRPARIVGIHQALDLAMLKVDAERLPTVEWKSDSPSSVGQWVATPGTGELPVAVGVVSVRRLQVPAERGVLGISTADANPGTRITEVIPNSGADKAGLQIGDVITQAAGKSVSTKAALTKMIRRLFPGDSFLLIVRRGEEELTLRAKLTRPFTSLISRGSFQNRTSGELSARRAGFSVVLQHDTVLRPVECGGPLVDLSGKAVGLNIARAGRTETFAVPADQILPLLDDLKLGKLAP